MENKAEHYNTESHCKIVVIGDQKSGKSSLIYRYADDGYNPRFCTEFHIDFKIKIQRVDGGYQVKNTVWDSQISASRFASSSVSRHVDAVIITVDMTNRESFTHLSKWTDEIDKHGKEKVIIAVAATKCDLKDKQQVTVSELSDYLTPLNIPYRLVSAKNAEGVESLFDLIDRKHLSQSVKDFEDIEQSATHLQASLDEMNELIELIKSQCSNFSYWKTKVRKGFGTSVSNDIKIPQGISQLLMMSQNIKGKKIDLLKNIGLFTDSKHSSYLQCFHFFLRGRDDETNKFYGILAQLKDGASSSVVHKIINELKDKFPVLDDNKPEIFVNK